MDLLPKGTKFKRNCRRGVRRMDKDNRFSRQGTRSQANFKAERPAKQGISHKTARKRFPRQPIITAKHALFLEITGHKKQLSRYPKKTHGLSQKIQGTYFKISALYFKIYGLFFCPWFTRTYKRTKNFLFFWLSGNCKRDAIFRVFRLFFMKSVSRHTQT